jgi:hypothetical protein
MGGLQVQGLETCQMIPWPMVQQHVKEVVEKLG